jgi:hypothetical protein
MYRRDDVNTPWEITDPAFLDYVKTNYIDTNKVTNFRKMDQDTSGLFVVIGSEWTSKEVFEEFCQDPVVVAEREMSIAYNIANSIFLIEEHKDGVQVKYGNETL